MIARRLTLANLACLCASAGVLALAGASAQAAVTHEFLPAVSAEITEGVPASSGAPLTGPLSGVNAMTVDSGELYVAEHLEGTSSYRVDKFNASTGAFFLQFPQAPPLTGTERGVAVRHPAAEAAQVYVGAVREGKGRVAVFSTTGGLLAAWTGVGVSGGEFLGEGVRDVAVDNSSSLSDWAKEGGVYEVNGNERAVDVFTCWTLRHRRLCI